MTTNCKKCNQSIKADEQVYETRIGNMAIIELRDFATGKPVFETEFQPDEVVEYWHVQCPIPLCEHKGKPIVPTSVEVQESPVWKVSIEPEVMQHSSKDYHVTYKWRPTEYGELGLTVLFSHKETVDDFTSQYVFVKCAKCGVILSA